MQHPHSIATLVQIIAATVLTATLCSAAQADYRCADAMQLTQAETRACELAQEDTPEALVHFVNRTKGTYNLLVDDYVSPADVERWERAKGGTRAHASTLVDANDEAEEDSKTE